MKKIENIANCGILNETTKIKLAWGTTNKRLINIPSNTRGTRKPAKDAKESVEATDNEGIRGALREDKITGDELTSHLPLVWKGTGEILMPELFFVGDLSKKMKWLYKKYRK